MGRERERGGEERESGRRRKRREREREAMLRLAPIRPIDEVDPPKQVGAPADGSTVLFLWR